MKEFDECVILYFSDMIYKKYRYIILSYLGKQYFSNSLDIQEDINIVHAIFEILIAIEITRYLIDKHFFEGTAMQNAIHCFENQKVANISKETSYRIWFDILNLLFHYLKDS